MPAAQLMVIGNWSEAAKSKLAAPRLSFSGYVQDLPETLRGGIMLVPCALAAAFA
jgi:hypothetical protein